MTRTPITAGEKVAIAIFGPIVFIAAYTIGTIGKYAFIDLMGMI